MKVGRLQAQEGGLGQTSSRLSAEPGSNTVTSDFWLPER